MSGDKGDKLNIRLHVYDRDLPVTILRDDEEYYRKASKLITDTVNAYASVYKGRKSDDDILYMAMIDIALRLEKQAGQNDTEPFMDIITKLTSEIEDALKK